MDFCVNMNINNQSVSVLFDWTGRDEDGGPDWETMEIHALLPTPAPSKAMYWVLVNDLLSDEDWKNVEVEIYSQWKELERQAHDNEY